MRLGIISLLLLLCCLTLDACGASPQPPRWTARHTQNIFVASEEVVIANKKIALQQIVQKKQSKVEKHGSQPSQPPPPLQMPDRNMIHNANSHQTRTASSNNNKINGVLRRLFKATSNGDEEDDKTSKEQCMKRNVGLEHPTHRVKGAVLNYEGCYLEHILGDLRTLEVPLQKWIRRDAYNVTFPWNPFTRINANWSATDPFGPDGRGFKPEYFPLPRTSATTTVSKNDSAIHITTTIGSAVDLPSWIQLPFVNYSSEDIVPPLTAAWQKEEGSRTSSSSSLGSTSEEDEDISPLHRGPYAGSGSLGGQEFIDFQHQCAAACADIFYNKRLTYFTVHHGSCKCMAGTDRDEAYKIFETARRTPSPECCRMAYPGGSVSTIGGDIPSTSDNNATLAREEGYPNFYSQPPQCSTQSKYATVFSLTLMCPVNISLCEKVEFCEVHDGCCVPKGSVPQDKSIFTITMVHWMITFFIVLLVCQMIWWVLRFRMRQYERQFEDGESPLLGAGGALDVPDMRRSKVEAELASRECMALFAQKRAVNPDAEETPAIVSPTNVAPAAAIDEDEDGCCPMCLDDFKVQRCVRTPCGHVIHYKCMKEFLAFALRSATKAPACPNCRQDLLEQRELRDDEVEEAMEQISARARLKEREEEEAKLRRIRRMRAALQAAREQTLQHYQEQVDADPSVAAAGEGGDAGGPEAQSGEASRGRSTAPAVEQGSNQPVSRLAALLPPPTRTEAQISDDDDQTPPEQMTEQTRRRRARSQARALRRAMYISELERIQEELENQEQQQEQEGNPSTENVAEGAPAPEGGATNDVASSPPPTAEPAEEAPPSPPRRTRDPDEEFKDIDALAVVDAAGWMPARVQRLFLDSGIGPVAVELATVQDHHQSPLKPQQDEMGVTSTTNVAPPSTAAVELLPALTAPHSSAISLTSSDDLPSSSELERNPTAPGSPLDSSCVQPPTSHPVQPSPAATRSAAFFAKPAATVVSPPRRRANNRREPEFGVDDDENGSFAIEMDTIPVHGSPAPAAAASTTSSAAPSPPGAARNASTARVAMSPSTPQHQATTVPTSGESNHYRRRLTYAEGSNNNSPQPRAAAIPAHPGVVSSPHRTRAVTTSRSAAAPVPATAAADELDLIIDDTFSSSSPSGASRPPAATSSNNKKNRTPPPPVQFDDEFMDKL